VATRNKVDTIFVQSFGGLTVYHNHVPKVVKWQSNKARLLFCYLIISYNQWVHRDRLIELLWPGSDPISSEKNFRCTLNRLRNSLSEFKIKSVLRMGDAYRLNFETISCDYAMFCDDATAGIRLMAKGDIEGALAHLVKADELCVAEFLPEEPSDPFIQVLRQNVGKLYATVLDHLRSICPEDMSHNLRAPLGTPEVRPPSVPKYLRPLPPTRGPLPALAA